MSEGSIAPLSGAVVQQTSSSATAYHADFMAFTFRAAQGVEGVTPFGSNTCSKNVGAGTPDFAYSVAANALAHSALSQPNLPGGAGMFYPGGGATPPATTLTLSTGCSESFPSVVGDYTTGAARMRAAIPVGISGKNYGDVTESWATS